MIPLTSEDNKRIECRVGSAILSLTEYGRRTTNSKELEKILPDKAEMNSGLRDLNAQGFLKLIANADGIYELIAPKNGLREHLNELQDDLQKLSILKEQTKFNRVIAFTGAILALTAILEFMKNEGFGWKDGLTGSITFVIILVLLIGALGYVSAFIIRELFYTKK